MSLIDKGICWVHRWLLSQGQTDRAIEILRTFARINKKQVDERVYKELKVAASLAASIVIISVKLTFVFAPGLDG